MWDTVKYLHLTFNSELNIPDGIVVMGDGESMLSNNQCENDPVPFEVREAGWLD